MKKYFLTTISGIWEVRRECVKIEMRDRNTHVESVVAQVSVSDRLEVD